MYLDGVEDASGPRPEFKHQLPSAAGATLNIGSDADPGEAFDDFRIHDYSRTAQQIRGDYSGGADITVEPVLPMRDAQHVRIPLVIYPDERMAVRVTNFSSRARTVELGWRITDLNQPEFKLRKMGSRKVELPAGGNHVETVYVPKDEMTPYGLFEVATDVKEGGRVVSRRVRTFGAGPRPVDLSKVRDSDFGFGVWMGGCWVDDACGATGLPTYDRRSVEPLTYLGHKWERVAFSWCRIEKQRGQFDWTDTDALVAGARENHVSLMPCLAGSADWASSAPEGFTNEQLDKQFHAISGRHAYIPKDLKDWDNYVFQVVSRYKGSIKYWNVWNEPIGGGFLTGWDAAKHSNVPGASAQEARLYFDLVKTASLAAKRADPEAKIVIEPCWGTWMDNLTSFENGELFKIVDVFAWHWYSNTTEIGPEARIATIRSFTAPLRQKAGGAIHVWDTEGGGLANTPRRTNRPTTPDELRAEIARNNQAFQWMGWSADEWDHAGRTVRDFVVKWGEGVEKVFGGYYDCYSNMAQTGPNVCCWRDGSPVVTALATTVLIDTLGGARFVRKLDAPEGQYAYLFRNGGRHILVCWTTKGKGVMHLDLHAPAVTVTDILGNQARQETRNGMLTREVTGQPFYITGVSPDPRVLPERMTLALGAPLIAAGEKISLTAEINNPFDAPLRGELSLELPAGWKAEPAAGTVECRARESIRRVFNIVAPAGAADGDYEIGSVLVEKDSRTAKAARLKVKTPVGIPKVKAPPTIDGDLAKWNDSPVLAMDRREQVKIGLVDPNLRIIQPFVKHQDAWQGPKDLSGQVRLGWDETNLYIAAKVTDDDVMHNKLFFATGDCLEVFIDLGAVKSGPGTVSGMGQILQCWFIPPVEGSPKPECGVFQGGEKLVGAQVASKRTPGGYTLEIALPWSNVAGFKPVKGAILSAELGLNDADKNFKDGKEVKSKIMWHGGANAYGTTENYGLWRLV
jgi:hypothetical protein